MERYKLEEVMSGRETDCVWVTLGFSSPLCANDVLHIVRGPARDDESSTRGMAGLYLERFEQGYSCYGGVEHIAATPLSVRVRLTEKGRTALDFANTDIWFDVSNDLAKYDDALAALQQMMRSNQTNLGK